MRTLIAILFVLLLIVPVGAQTIFDNAPVTKVVTLTPADAATSLDLYTQLATIQAKIAAHNQHIRTDYLTSKADTLTYGAQQFKNGWTCGLFVYSDDYKHIVPVVVVSSKSKEEACGEYSNDSSTLFHAAKDIKQ